MVYTLRTVDLNNGMLSKLLVRIDDSNSLTWTLIVKKPNENGGTTEAQLPITESQVDLILKVAAFR